jgi:hypothetical protein
MKTIKKFILVVLAIGFAITTFGQTNGGKILLGGSSNLNFDHSTSKWKNDNNSGTNSKTTGINFMPQAGIFICNGLAIGLNLDVWYSIEKDENGSKYTNTMLAGSPFVRYYFGKAKIKPFLEARVGGGFGSYKSDPDAGPSSTSKYTTFDFGFTGGVAMFLNDHVSLDLGLGFSSSTSKDKTDNPNHFKSIDRTIGLNIGITTIL